MIKHLILLKIQNMMDIKLDLLQCFIYFFDKKLSGRATKLARSETLLSVNLAARATKATRKKSVIKNENISNEEVAEELYKPIIGTFNC